MSYQTKSDVLFAGMVGSAIIAFCAWAFTGEKPVRPKRQSRYKKTEEPVVGLPGTSDNKV